MHLIIQSELLGMCYWAGQHLARCCCAPVREKVELSSAILSDKCEFLPEQRCCFVLFFFSLDRVIVTLLHLLKHSTDRSKSIVTNISAKFAVLTEWTDRWHYFMLEQCVET